MEKRLGQVVRIGLFLLTITVLALLPPLRAHSAPYAAMVMDARTGEVLHSRNADTRLHPASLTKMMTLYVTFEALRKGEITLDTVVTVSRKAANEPPSKLGLRAGQKIKLRYLIRAAAVKSANDAATALGEAVAGSEAAFARRMNRTAKALGMSRSTFKNAHGLTEAGHMSTARDMTNLGRHLFYDYPEYYNLFSRRSTDAGVREVPNTNTRFLNAYKGADGIKTGYTRAAGFNLVASAERGSERIITTVFGGVSTAARNAKVAELMDLGFRRAPSKARVKKPHRPVYADLDDSVIRGSGGSKGATGKSLRVSGVITKSPRPILRPLPAVPDIEQDVLVAMAADIENVLTAVNKPTAEPEGETVVAQAPAEEAKKDTTQEAIKASVADVVLATASEPPGTNASPAVTMIPQPRPSNLVLASVRPAAAVTQENTSEVVTRISTSGGRHWGINIGTYGSRYEADWILLKTALKELETLDDALRKVSKTGRGYDANFVGMTEDMALMACRRLSARNVPCTTLGPG